MAGQLIASLNDRLAVKNYDRDGNPRPVQYLDNDHLRPIPVSDRRWTQLTYVMFWFSGSACVSNFYAANTGMTAGLTMWESVLCSLGGHCLVGVMMALNGRGGAVYK